jgi:hypothetical protein
MTSQEPVTSDDDKADDTAEQHKSRPTQKTDRDTERIRYNPSRESDR